MVLLRLFISISLAILASPLSAGGLVVAAPDEVMGLIEPYLPKENRSPSSIEATLGAVFATEGYFTPTFKFRAEGEETRVEIDPGPRTIVGSVELVVDGDFDQGTRESLLQSWRLPVGQPFRQADWNAAKQDVLAQLLAFEYADARLVASRAEIDPEIRRARLQARYLSGPRYRFGRLVVRGQDRFQPALVERYNRMAQPGAAYSEEAVYALQAALQATPYFGSVQVGLDRNSATTGTDGTVTAPLVVTVRERPAHRIGVGVGASSNTGARVEANYHTPDLLGRAWSLESGVRVEQKRQVAFADVFLPPDARGRRHGVGAMAEATDIQGLRTERYAFGGQSVQQRGSVEQRLSLTWEEERRWHDTSAPVISQALAPNVMWTWRRVDSLVEPRQGTVLQLQIGGGSKAVLSDQDFLRLHGRALQYLPLGRNDTLALRVEAGRTFADSRKELPQDYLFRTGGTGSVRGYAYQSLGLKEGTATVGGRYLAVLSAEVTHWVDDRWGVAAFVDAGDAVDLLRDARFAVGYGLGARWRSPAGPLGIDLAYGQRTASLQLHFSLSIPF